MRRAVPGAGLALAAVLLAALAALGALWLLFTVYGWLW